jgi:hypothetical protein
MRNQGISNLVEIRVSDVTLYEGQEVGRRKGTYVNNVNALGNANQHVNKLNDFNILYGNADSLRNKLDVFSSPLGRIKYQIIYSHHNIIL